MVCDSSGSATWQIASAKTELLQIKRMGLYGRLRTQGVLYQSKIEEGYIINWGANWQWVFVVVIIGAVGMLIGC